jgi:hypothetical protein
VRSHSETRNGEASNLEMLVEFVEDEAHAIHEAIHVRRCPLVVGRVLMRCERFLEHLEISHPFEGERVRLDVGLVEDDDERKLGLVKDTGEY